MFGRRGGQDRRSEVCNVLLNRGVVEDQSAVFELLVDGVALFEKPEIARGEGERQSGLGVGDRL
jgi:hypothetical protein